MAGLYIFLNGGVVFEETLRGCGLGLIGSETTGGL